MERRTQIIIGVAAGLLVVGGVVGAVIWRRAALEREAGGLSPTAPPGSVKVIVNSPAGGANVNAAPRPREEGAAMLGGPNLNEPAPPGPPPTPNAIDSDGDSLSNEKEAELGTDPNKVDSDGDGVADGDEVFITKTDPKSNASKPKR